MKGIIDFSVQKAITVFMAVIAVSIFGVVSFTRLTTDLFPNVNIPFAVVVTTYPGASPEEVEARVSVPLETVFQTTTNIVQVTSMSQENVSIIMLEFNANANMDSAVIEMRENLNFVLDVLPESAGNPNIIRLNPDLLPIVTYSVTYDGKDPQALTEWVDDVMRPRVERVPGVASFTVSGGFSSELRIMLDETALDNLNDQIAAQLDLLRGAGQPIPEDLEIVIDKDMVSGILTAQNFSFPAGFLEVAGSNYLIRVGDSFSSLEEIQNLLLFDGTMFGLAPVRLEDIAEVTFAAATDRIYSKVNGENALTISVQKGSEFATTDVSNRVNDVLRQLAEEDDNVTVTMLLDQGEFINQSTGSVIANLLVGGVLAIIILFIFLRSFRVTFIVGVAIPISLLFAVVLIYLSGITLNIVSLGGLALGIGMLVDNGIVVVENIFRMKKEGASNKEAALHGTHQVAGAITASTLTTIGVFLPVMFIEDFIREIFFQLALTITFSLAASLLIALTLVPSLASKVLDEDTKAHTKDQEGPSRLDKVKQAYGRALSVAFRFKTLILSFVLVLFAVSIWLATSRGFEFFPATDEGTLSVSLQVSNEQPLTFTEFTATLDALYLDLLTIDDIETIGISLGGGLFGFGGGAGTGDRANVTLVLRDDRVFTTAEVREEVLALLEDAYTHIDFEISGTQGDIAFLVGSGLQIRLRGNDLEAMRAEALEIVSRLETVEGLRDIDPGFGRESREIKVTVDKEAAIAVGLTVGQVLGFLAEYASGPASIGQARLSGTTYDIYVYEPGDTRRVAIDDVATLETLPVGANPITGQPVLLGAIAEITVQPGFRTISRIDGARTLTIDAQFEPGFNATLVASDVDAVLADYTPTTGIDYEVLGESQEVLSALNTLTLVVLLAVVIVYMIMASQFQSLVYPFIIMITIPLAFTGGFLILYLFGMPVSIVAMIGLIILSGVVVNNGIVLVDYINQVRDTGKSLEEAIIEAGQTRLRPIFMTALTTILALSALAIGFGEGAELIQPMALTAIGGLMYATLLTIFVVPIMYYSITMKGRLVAGIFFTLTGLVAAVVLLVMGFWLYAALAGIIGVGAFLLMVFIPKKPKEATLV
ncbi:MAG: efflux RND transporter permease subunit [Acholeplasmatales bacterium]|nr:MAG: efflux RND transporter permease subunit [Acholeplasmatales bacterium]